MEYLYLLPVLIGALITTGLLLYGIWGVVRTHAIKERIVEFARALGLLRTDINPLIEPAGHAWEAGGVMNPATVEAGGRVHLFYRALGADGVSRIGYASSADGVRFDERLPYPVFALEGGDTPQTRRYALHSGLHKSGGSFAGVEDPRAVIIDDRMYMTFSAFGGWDALRMAVSSIAVRDLVAKRWSWTPPSYLSPVGQVHKNWVLFPEKINGKFAILHSLHSGSRDRVLVDYLDTLDEDANIESPYNPVKDESVWDSTLRGAGPPPLKTKDGWLLLYHATDAREPNRYKIGALLLDLNDPTKVIARAPLPILAPDAVYENEGAKSGVVYACGATIQGDTLTVYYGGADSVVCAAKISLPGFLKKLRTAQAAKLKPVSRKTALH
jgi:predicted GH43/DUF377 family glycosyl hydrolase